MNALTLVDLTLRGALVTAVVLGLDAALGRWLSARHRRLLWLVPPFAFLVPGAWPLPFLPVAGPAALSAPAAASWENAALPFQAVSAASLSPWLLLWAAGALLTAGIVLVRTVRASRRWREARFCTDPALLEPLEDCRRLAGVRVPVALIVSDAVPAPALLGWLRPRLLLPAAWLKDRSPAQLRNVLLHELAHLRAADLAWGWLVTVMRAVHWFNPLAHLAARRWQAAREHAADEAVLNQRVPPASYAETLLAFVRTGRSSPPCGALGISENLTQLKHRIHMIQAHPRRVLPVVAFTALLAAVLAVTFLRPTHAAPSEADQKAVAVAAMTAWLGVVDAGDYARSWTEASRAFREAVTQEKWVAAARAARQPCGALKERTLASAMLQKNVPAGGQTLEGEFVIAQFRSSFANLAAALETVTFEREADGVWRASGYYITPAP